MKHALITSLLLVLALSLSQLRAQPAQPPRGAPAGGGISPPTTQALQQMLDAKEYQQVLKESQRMLSIKGAAARDIDKADVLMLRGEAYLQLKQQGQAADSYRQVSKDATDPGKVGLAKAMLTLIQKSKNFMYSPKPNSDPTKPATPLNIIDPKERKLALAALFDDEWKPTQTKIDALKKQGNTKLPPILEAANLAGEMRGLEMAATGTDAKTSTALSDLTENAIKLMNDYIDRQTKNVDEIDQAANRPQNGMVNETNRAGLTAVQTNDLKTVTSDCKRLGLAANEVADSAGPKANEFRMIADRSGTLGKCATDVLNADYSQPLYGNRPMIMNNPPNQPITVPPIIRSR